MLGRTPEVLLDRLPADQRPAVTDLCFTTLRAFGRGDFFIAALMERPPVGREESARLLRALLLLAFNRLETRPDEAHTTVDQAVRAAGGLFSAASKKQGLVNGVLRSFMRQLPSLLGRADADRVARNRHPAWWLDRLQRDHPDDWPAIVDAGNQHPPMCLRPNLRRITSTNLRQALAEAAIDWRPVTDLPAPVEAICLERPRAVDRLPGFREGLCSVQDAGAQCAALLLDARDGQRVLDACAAPGGKTAHCLEQANIFLTAVEADARRAATLRDNLTRLGLGEDPSRLGLRIADARDLSSWWDGIPFDRILADVPCSASGVVRRHPDAKWLRRETDVAGFAETQADILAAVWQTLARGGKMLYATCSVFKEENAGQIQAFVEHHADARLQQDWQILPTPDHDGFYYALVEKS